MADHHGQGQLQTELDRTLDTPVQNGQKPAGGSAAANAKDPLRPRRKKAKRACFACQRAHLTCGDERPCQRCIKRGLQEQCHDGVRKKAKYLHDAPNEALMPGIRGDLYSSSSRGPLPLSRNSNGNGHSKSTQPNPSAHVYQQQSQQHHQHGNGYGNQPHMKAETPASHTQLQDNTIPPGVTYNAQSPISPTFTMTPNPAAPNQNATGSTTATPSTSGPGQNQFSSAAFFDPSDPALFNFDIASMNFGNHYGALEFGMLGHMATGAGDTPPSDTAGQPGQMGSGGQFRPPSTGASNFGESPTTQPSFLFEAPQSMGDWSQGNRNVYGQRSGQNVGVQDMPHAFAIESAPANFASPNSSESPLLTNPGPLDEVNNNTFMGRSSMGSQPHQRQQHHQQQQSQQQQHPVVSTPQLRHHGLHIDRKRRHRNPSTIYDSVREPYSYTTGFHSLTAFIQRRFSPQRTLQIAKALASIRPSFIATAKTLNRDDLVFMEKCFQRTLWEYEDFISACGTPTIVCRRTGEVAAVGKEFSILTGWKKEVLLGKEPNLNINTGGSGNYTPRGGSVEASSSYPYPNARSQPVFLAELLDDESVIEFYEDFAKLAFGDSRGSVMTTCKLLKYKTKEDMERLTSGEADAGGNNSTDQQSNQRKWSKGGIAGEAGMNQLGFRDGKVECSYCWTVKRDVFDIPMLIVMNFLPCI